MDEVGTEITWEPSDSARALANEISRYVEKNREWNRPLVNVEQLAYRLEYWKREEGSHDATPSVTLSATSDTGMAAEQREPFETWQQAALVKARKEIELMKSVLNAKDSIWEKMADQLEAAEAHVREMEGKD